MQLGHLAGFNAASAPPSAHPFILHAPKDAACRSAEQLAPHRQCLAFFYPLCHLWISMNLTDFTVQPGRLRQLAVMARSCLCFQKSQLRANGVKSCAVNTHCDFCSQATEAHIWLQAVFRPQFPVPSGNLGSVLGDGTC